MIAFNRGQNNAINDAVRWYYDSPEQVFQIAGNPGTGKSCVLDEIIRRLGLSINEVAPMAYTGAAAIVMRMKGMMNAGTIHSWMYEAIELPVFDKQGNPVMDPYFNKQLVDITFVPKDLIGIKLIIIDEASMVPMNMKAELLSRGIKIIAAGDLDQLPPVADKPAFLVDGKIHVLTEIMRQAAGSAIIYLSQRAKMGMPIPLGFYNNVWVCNEEDLTKDIILGSNVVLTGKNDTRERYNRMIREDFLDIHSTLPIYGDRVICRKNNRNIEVSGINLANGLAGRVVSYPDVSNFDGKSFYIDFMPDLLNATFKDIRCDYRYLISSPQDRRELKKLRYDTGEMFEYGYASTVHLAQGSQFNNGIYIEEYMGDISNALNYTALTRFANLCIYVRQKRKCW